LGIRKCRFDLEQDTVGSVNWSKKGAQIWITDEGKVAYTLTPTLQAELRALEEGQHLLDTFVYAMRKGVGPLSWATATVKLSGINNPPELTGTVAELADGTANAPYTILASDLLTGFTDADGDTLSASGLTATNGTLTKTAEGWLFTPDADYSGIVELHYDVVDVHGASVSATQSFVIAPAQIDNIAPTLISSYPGSDTTTLKDHDNIILYFDEAVTAGSGEIIISSETDTRFIDINDSSQVIFNNSKSGNTIIVDPAEDLIPNTTYSIQIAEGVITDLAGNPYAGIHDDTTLNFTTTSNPLLWDSNPWSGSAEFQVDSNIELHFDEAVKAGNGNIIISNESDIRIIDVNDASQVTFDEYGSVIINPIEDLQPNTTYSIQIASGVITDLAGHVYTGTHDDAALNFTTIPSNPLLQYSNLLDNATEFQVDSNIELYFNEAVQAGSGDIVISNGSDTRIIDITDSSQVTLSKSGNTVIIDPTDDLIPDTTYSIQIAEGAITDLAGHTYAGIQDDTTLSFTTIPSNPLLWGSYPWNDATEFQVDSNINLYFNEAVQVGNGSIVISNGTDTRTVNVNDTSQVIFDGYSSIIIDLTEDLIPHTTYSVRIDEGIVIDLAGNPFTGIHDDTTLNFTTIPSDPVLQGSNLENDIAGFQVDNDITLFFNEAIQAGNGNIVISNGTDTRTININDSSQVTFSKFNSNFITINPTDDLVPNTAYSIQIDEGTVIDLAGNPFAGIHDDTTLNFTTIPSNPLLRSSFPVDGAADFEADSNIILHFNESVIAGDGNIVLSNGVDTRTISVNDTDQVQFNGSKSVTIDPAQDLIPNTTYSIQIEEGAITDRAGNAFTGISDDTTLSFAVIEDTFPPVLIDSYPWDDAHFEFYGDIALWFDDQVTAGSGDIIISNSDGTDTRIINVTNTDQVTFWDNSVYIDPGDDLLIDNNYFIQMESGVIVDTAGNAYAGISDDTTLNFTTYNPATVFPSFYYHPPFITDEVVIVGITDPGPIIV
jgi:methionine-rich copper-binding protein CopC